MAFKTGAISLRPLLRGLRRQGALCGRRSLGIHWLDRDGGFGRLLCRRLALSRIRLGRLYLHRLALGRLRRRKLGLLRWGLRLRRLYCRRLGLRWLSGGLAGS